jgi:hypothetical protein
MVLNPATRSFFIVRDWAWKVRRTLTMFAHCLVSGHGEHIKDTNGDELGGLDECSFLSPLWNSYD